MSNIRCERCQGPLSFADQAGPITIKGGFSGHFCPSCMNLWNEAYHASDACSRLREADLKLMVLAATAKSGNTELAVTMDAVGSVAQMFDSAMKDLYFLAKETLAPIMKVGMKESFEIGSFVSPGAFAEKAKLDNISESKETYISPISGKPV